MPIFMKAIFLHTFEVQALGIEDRNTLRIKLYLNQQIVAMHELSLAIFLKDAMRNGKNSEWSS
jgi:hypothetical protein